MGNFQWIKSIWHLLDDQSCAELRVSLCISHLDYANLLLFGLAECALSKLQRVQNISARLALRKGRYDSLAECLHKLHWLPVHYRIDFKILVLSCKCLNEQGPQYLHNLIVELKPTKQSLHSESSHKLLIPKIKHETFAARLFSVLAPALWNSLPEDIKMIKDVLSFKKALKTYLFRLAFNL